MATGVERILKSYPDMERYRFELGITEEVTNQVMSNHTTKWYQGNPTGVTDSLPIDRIMEIAAGVPRRYPLHHINVILDNLSILGGGTLTKERQLPYRMHGGQCATSLFNASSPYTGSFYPSACIHIRSDWWTSGRINQMDAIVHLGEVDLSSSAAPNMNINDEVRGFINQLGDVEYEAAEAVPSSIEESHRLSEKFLQADRIIKVGLEVIDKFDFPHTLPKISTYDYQTDPISPKKSIQRAFSKAGFGKVFAVGGHGYYSVSKYTPNHNMVKLIFERGKLGGDLSCRMIVGGPLWKHAVPIPCSPVSPYRLINQEDCDWAIENAAAIYDHLEKKWIGEIDRIYGQAPSWFIYQLD